MSFVAGLGGWVLFLARTLWATRARTFSWREVLHQLDEVAVRSAPLVVGGLGFFGAVAVTIAQHQARRLTGNLIVLGPPYFVLMVREFGPVLSTLLASARLGAGHAAELSAMAVQEQLEALEMSAGDPLVDLVAPRWWAGVLGYPILCALGTAAATLSAAGTAQWVFHVDGRAFFDAELLRAGDLLCGLAKAVLCGALVPVAALRWALTARGGAEAVGTHTTDGVVRACLVCLLVDAFIALLFRALGI